MTAPNPPELEHALADWQDWNIGLSEKPQNIESLQGGTSNSSYLITVANAKAKDAQWVLRIHKQNLLFKTDREHELAIQAVAEQLQLAPEIVYQHPHGHYQLYRYIDAQPLSTHLPICDNTLQTLCAQLKQLHQCGFSLADSPFSAYLYSDHINRYWRLLLQKGSMNDSTCLTSHDQQQYKAILALTLTYEQTHGQQRVLCHHDLNADNILLLENNHCCILDWEFAGAGIASMDFACLATELHIDIKEMSALSGIDQNELDCAQQIYQYTCEVYNRALKLISN